MDLVSKLLIFGGLIIAAASQAYIIFAAFRYSVLAGLVCLFLTPLYAFFSDLRKENNVGTALKIWVTGVAIFFLGVLIIGSVK